METLPLIAGHDVEVMCLVEILHVLGIHRQLQVVGVFLVPLVVAVVVGGKRVFVFHGVGAPYGSLLTC